MTAIAPLARSVPETGVVCLRNGVTVALFLERFVHQCGDALTAALDRFLAFVPPGSIRHAVVSATSDAWRDADAAAMKRMRDALAPAGAKKRKLTAFRFNDHGPEAPQYGFRLVDRDKDEPEGPSRTLVELTFPPAAADADRVEALVALVHELTALLAPAYGYVAPSLLPADGAVGEGFGALRSLALRHPGYDVAMNDLTQLRIGSHTRGARWITILGQALERAAGGAAALRAQLSPAIEHQLVGPALVLRAGATPELGDTDRREPTPLLRELARALEPVTLFREIDLLSYLADFDEDVLRAWERRFLD